MLWTKSSLSSKLRRLRKNEIDDREVQFVDYEVQNHARYVNETRGSLVSFLRNLRRIEIDEQETPGIRPISKQDQPGLLNAII